MKSASVGTQAEKAAEAQLQKAGLRLVARNARVGRGEIDLIMLDGNTLVFIEVRCRKQTGLVTPQETVDFRKQAQVRANAERWLAANPRYRNHYCRFDVISVRHNNGKLDPPKWIKDAFN
ncbi:MAG TPA: YraN family protein [Halothiobacillaceae bacterium]|nr:YraN family protein [Halothiobacillaceae bacterium]